MINLDKELDSVLEIPVFKELPRYKIRYNRRYKMLEGQIIWQSKLIEIKPGMSRHKTKAVIIHECVHLLLKTLGLCHCHTHLFNTICRGLGINPEKHDFYGKCTCFDDE